MTITINQAVWLQVLFVFLQAMSHPPEDMFNPTVIFVLRAAVGALQVAITLIAAKSFPDGTKIPPPVVGGQSPGPIVLPPDSLKK
jgi:hypothetical protein